MGVLVPMLYAGALEDVVWAEAVVERVGRVLIEQAERAG